MPRITFAIPFYSDLSFLEQAVESVLAQSLTDWELVISDDHSVEDGAAAIASRHPDARIRCVRNPETVGMAGNWNRCLDLARTDLVTILHSDDRLLPDYAALMVAAAERDREATAFFCDAVVIDAAGATIVSAPELYKRLLVPRGQEPFRVHGEDGLARLMKGDFIMCPSLCYRRERLGELRFSHQWKMVLDLDLESALLLRGDTLVGLREKAYAYRRHAANSSLKYTHDLLRFREEVAIFRTIDERARARGWRQAAGVASRRRIIRLNLLYHVLRDMLTLRLRGAASKTRFLVEELLAG
jgi:glycosyltransferase involved in cell wall biosynthesis